MEKDGKKRGIAYRMAAHSRQLKARQIINSLEIEPIERRGQGKSFGSKLRYF
jgi:hypothetical protein